MQRALENAMADLVLGDEVDPTDERAVDAWLERNAVPEEDRRAILEQGVERLSVYRSLVRGNIRRAIADVAPRTVARLGELFDEYLGKFLRERAPRTHYLRDVTVEWLDFSEPLWCADERVPDYLADLARHECTRIEIGARESKDRDREPGELSLDRGVELVPAARVVRYRYAVHQLSDEQSDRTAPQKRGTTLFVYRSPEHEVRYLELSPLAALVLEALADGATLGSAIKDACAQQGVEIDDAVLSGTATVLADLAARGALLGSAAPAT